MNRILLAGAVVALAGLVGCNQSDPGGKTNSNTPSKQTFKVKAPATGTTIKQGDKQTVKLTIDRGSEFKEAVNLKVDNPKGISVELDPKKVKSGDPETVTATVSVDKDAAVGEHKVKVTATPETGNATDVEFKVTVEKKAD